MVLGCSYVIWWLLVVFGCSWWFLVVFVGSWWFLVDLVGSCWFLVVIREPAGLQVNSTVEHIKFTRL